MRLEIYLDANEEFTNIGLAKALIESTLPPKALREVAQHLLVYVENNPELLEEGANQ